MFKQPPLHTALALLLVSAGVIYAFTTDFFGKEILIEVAIVAILAMALDFVAGFGGMVSLAHGALFGIGAYVYATFTIFLDVHPALAMLSAIGIAGLAGLLMGFATARVHGIFFIMATLAFGQMVYVYIFESRALGGDDGLPGVPQLDLSAFGILLFDPTHFALFVITNAVLVYIVLAWVLSSSFGQALVGLHRNEGRMRALGLPVGRYKAAAFALSGGVAGLAGTLNAQFLQFVSPDYLAWTASGEALVIVILGGIETLIGPVIGAVVFTFAKHTVNHWTEYWHVFVGGFLIVAVLAGGRGLFGLIQDLTRLAGRALGRTGASDA